MAGRYELCQLLSVYSGSEKCKDLPPYFLVNQHACGVAAPSGTKPTYALIDEFGVTIHRCGKFCLWAILNTNLPAMVDHPACNKDIIIRFHELNKAEPLLMQECMDEIVVLHNAGSY